MGRFITIVGLSPLLLVSECVIGNPGGSKTNPNRPTDAETSPAAFSPLSAVNRSLPEWLCFTAGYRIRMESYDGGSFEPATSDSYLLTRFRFGMSLKPASWFKIYSEVQDADAFGKTPPRLPPYQETWDLRRAYVDIGDVDEGRWGFRVGRQDLNFEDGRLIGTSYWRNGSHGYDAVQAVLNWRSVSTTAFAASPIILDANGLSHHQPGNNIYGLNSKIGGLVPGGLLESFLFWRLTPGLKTESGASGELDEKTIGARISGLIGKAWDYDMAGAGQLGHQGSDRLGAWTWMGTGGYTFQTLRPKIRVFRRVRFRLRRYQRQGRPARHIRSALSQHSRSPRTSRPVCKAESESDSLGRAALATPKLDRRQCLERLLVGKRDGWFL